MNMDQYSRAQAAAAFIQAQFSTKPAVGIILGSGLGAFAAKVSDSITIPYADIPHFPQSTVEGHSGNLILGTIAGVSVAVMQGRVHAYEGYGMEEVTFPTRVLGLLGCSKLFVTNAAGGINPEFGPGTLVAISDHINLTGTNAALGANDARFGPRFFDMTSAYSKGLRGIASEEAEKLGMELPEGVYLAVLGPSYETAAEIRAFRTLGADLVGMSTVHEVIVARHMGIECLGISLVTNAAAGVSAQVIHHGEVMDIGRQAAEGFTALLTAILSRVA
jgi:purine-nucleoside phosphorylase